MLSIYLCKLSINSMVRAHWKKEKASWANKVGSNLHKLTLGTTLSQCFESGYYGWKWYTRGTRVVH